MDPAALQRTRYLLRARFRLALKGPRPLVRPACQHLLAWLDSHALFGPVITRLRRSDFDARMSDAAEKNRKGQAEKFARVETTNGEEHAALCLSAVRAVANERFKEAGQNERYLHWVYEALNGEEPEDDDEAYEVFREVALDGLYDYLDEQLDSRNAVFSLLRKYQRRCEWFSRNRLRSIAETGTEGIRAGERSLAFDLQAYLYDQGVDFSVEPTVAIGEPDLVLTDSDGRHVVVDAKYVPSDAPPSKMVSAVAHGLHQVAQYCENFQEPAGFLVVFCDHKKKLKLPLTAVDGLSYFLVRSIIVYVLVVDIHDSPTASKLGRAEEVVVSREQLVDEVGSIG